MRRPRRLPRVLLLAFGMLVFLAFLTGIYLWHVPQSPRFLQEALRRRLEQVTGARVRFESGPPRLFVPDRRIEVRQVAFYSTADSQVPDFRLGGLDVTLSRAALLSPERPDAVERITLSEPTRIEYTWTPDGLHPSPAARFLAQTLERIFQTSGSGTGQIRIDHIEIVLREEPFSPAELEDRGADEGGGEDGEREPAPEITLRGALTASPARSGGAMTSFEGGLLAGGMHSGIHGVLLSESPTSRTLDLTFGRLQVPLPFRGRTVQVVAAAGARLRLALEQQGAAYAVSGAAEVPEFELEVSEPEPFRLSDRNVVVQLNASFEKESGVCHVAEVRFSSDLVDARASGSGSAHDPHPFEARTVATRLGGGYRTLLERLLPAGYQLEAPDEAFRLTATAEGDRHALNGVDGTLSFTSVTLASPALPRPLRNLQGEIAFRPGLIELKSLSATSGESHLRLEGTLEGDYLRGSEARLTLNWNANASARDLERFVSPPASHAGANRTVTPGSAGRISGSGTLRQLVSLRAPALESRPPEITGTIRFAEVDFASPAIREAVKGLNGTLTVLGDRVRLDSLSGTVRGTPVEVRGVVSGRRYFWRDPVLSATVTTRLDLSRLPDSLPEELRSAARQYRLEGTADARLQISADLDRPADLGVTGLVTVRNGTAEIPLSDSKLTVRGAQCSLSWDGSALILDRFSARVNGEPFRASGYVSPEQIALEAKGLIDLAAIPRSSPWVARWMELSGPADIDLRLQERPEAPDGGSAELLDLARSVGPRLVAAASGGRLDLNGSIVLGRGNTGARFRHFSMPGGERRNEQGRPVPPAELRNVRGRMILKGGTLATSPGAPLQCDLADTRDCRLETTIELRPGNFPRMTIRATSRGQARFDTWMTGWGKQLPVAPEPSDTGRGFELDLTFSAPSAVYKGQEAGPTRLELSYSLLQRPDSPRRTRFKRVEVSGGARGGRTVASGEILSYAWKPNDYPRWKAEAQFQQMPMLPLLTWIFRDVRNIDGRATGELSVEGVKTDPLRVQGRGNTVMTDLVIDRTPLIRNLARATGRQLQGRRFNSVDTTNFTIGGGALSSHDLNLDSAGGLLLEMRGRYFFADVPRLGVRARTIDARMRLKIFQSVLQQLPIVSGIPLVGELAGGVTQLADQVAGQFLLAFQVSGPADQPQITPIPLPLFQGGD